MPRGHAYAQAADPSWGRALVAADAAHLAHFDRERDKIVRKHKWILAAGLAAMGAGLGFLFIPGTLQFISVGWLLFLCGLFGSLAGFWIPWRLSFAAHRMWGIYERGMVAPFYVKGGIVAFVPWSSVSRVRQRRMRAEWADPVEGAWLFRAEEGEARYGRVHRFTESDLRAFFLYTPEEARALRDEIQGALARVLPESKVIVELELADA